jgi:hypothetical protein
MGRVTLENRVAAVWERPILQCKNFLHVFTQPRPTLDIDLWTALLAQISLETDTDNVVRSITE